jgi:hypothetical protein
MPSLFPHRSLPGLLDQFEHSRYTATNGNIIDVPDSTLAAPPKVLQHFVPEETPWSLFRKLPEYYSEKAISFHKESNLK